MDIQIKHELLSAMNDLFKIYFRSRSMTPYISGSPEDVPVYKLTIEGRENDYCFISTSQLYRENGYDCIIGFPYEDIIKPDLISQVNDVSHWINHSFFIELKNLLDNWIDWKTSELKSNDYFKLLHYIRVLFAHTSNRLAYIRKADNEMLQNAIEALEPLFPKCIEEDNKLNLSIKDFVIPFFEKIVKIIEDN